MLPPFWPQRNDKEIITSSMAPRYQHAHLTEHLGDCSHLSADIAWILAICELIFPRSFTRWVENLWSVSLYLPSLSRSSDLIPNNLAHFCLSFLWSHQLDPWPPSQHRFFLPLLHFSVPSCLLGVLLSEGLRLSSQVLGSRDGCVSWSLYTPSPTPRPSSVVEVNQTSTWSCAEQEFQAPKASRV